MHRWHVYGYQHGDVVNKRLLHYVADVNAEDALSALDKGRVLAGDMDWEGRFGGIEVRRADLPPLEDVIAEVAERNYAGAHRGRKRKTVD